MSSISTLTPNHYADESVLVLPLQRPIQGVCQLIHLLIRSGFVDIITRIRQASLHRHPGNEEAHRLSLTESSGFE
jgi:hypothetical protein